MGLSPFAAVLGWGRIMSQGGLPAWLTHDNNSVTVLHKRQDLLPKQQVPTGVLRDMCSRPLPQHFLILHSIKKLLMSNSMDIPIELRNLYFSFKHKNKIHWILWWMIFKSQPLLTAKVPGFPRKNAKLQQLLQRWQQCCSWSFRGQDFKDWVGQI